MIPLLSVRHLGVSYRGVPAVRDLSFNVNEGEVVALLGPNGAGKSSTLRAIMGVVSPTSGEIVFDGDTITDRSIDKIARLGIALVPEGRHIYGPLTVEENLRLGRFGRRDREGDRGGAGEDLHWVLDLFPILKSYLSRQAGVLSGGQQQQLAIARALVAGPRLLLLDEPSLGLAPAVIDVVFEALEEIRASGRTIVLVEQRASRAAAFANRTHVIANGKLRLSIDSTELNSTELSSTAAITSAYFGS